MASTAPTEVVRHFHEAWSEDDIDGLLAYVHPEMEFDWSESQGPFKGIYRGHEGMRRYWEDVREAWDSFTPTVEEVLDRGRDRLVTPTTVRGRARASGIELQARGTMVWVVRDGLIVRGKMFQTTEEALAATA